jgi:hypothetical protein
MKQLSSILTNVYYLKEKDKYERLRELIFLVDKANYIYSNEGDIIRERSIEQVRFSTNENGIGRLIEVLQKIKDDNSNTTQE